MKKNRYADTPFEEQPRPNTAFLGPKVATKLPEGAASADPQPVVTVVTAVFNAVKDGRKEELLQCLDSVQQQTGTTIEHLIIDGASSDGTADLIRNYPNPKVPIRLLSEPDEGIYDAMNRGIWLARGKYVIFLNSDDYYSNPAGLAECVRHLEESGADFSYAPITVLDEKTGQPVEHLLNHPDVNIVFLEMPFSHQSMMIRREAMLQINGFDLRYRSGADYDSVLRLIFSGHRACYVPVVFVAFRLGGFSFVNMEQSQREVGTIFSRLYKKYLNVDLSPKEGLQIYLSKQCSKELRKRQFRFARETFGAAIETVQAQSNDSVSEELLMLRFRLQTIKNHPGFAECLQIIVKQLCASPVLFARFLLLYFRARRSSGNVDAGKQAYLELLAQEQKKQKSASAGEKKRQGVVPTAPRLDVSSHDFWCVTGIYASEPWGAWTSKQFSVFFNIPKDCINRALTAEVYIGGYVFPESPQRTVAVIVNGRQIGSLRLENFMPQPQQISIPENIVTSSMLDIDFVADNAFVPNTLGHSGDTRELGMTFRKLSIRKTAAGNGGAPELPDDLQEIKVGFLNHFNKWWVGGITYFKNLFQAMATTESPRLRPFIFPSPDELADCLLPYVSAFPIPPPSPAACNQLPTAVDYQVDILSHLNGNQVSEGRDGIAWIADFQHLHLPEMFDEKEIAFRNHSFHTLIEQNRIVCLSSYDAMEDFKKYAPESADKARCLHFVSIPETEVFQLSEQEAAEIRRSRKLPERYFYVPNQFWKHKNHIVVLQAVALLKKAGCPVHVVFSGNTYDARFPHYFEELEAFCRQEQIREYVHFLGLIPLKEVYFLMRDCLAIINPSKFEGWSSSVEEAKSIGKTIFLSNLNVHYEQMPPNGTYFPVDDPDWLADLLKRAWNELKPGPDQVMEQQAREQLPIRVKQFGRDFQQIVLEALGKTESGKSVSQERPEVTVVTVIGSRRETDSKAQILHNLESVAAQKGISVEHLIVDCGNSEETSKALEPHLEQYGCRVLSAPVHGLYGAMNLGTIQAQGKYVAYCNPGEDYAADNFLKESVTALEKGQGDFSYPAGADETNCLTEMPFRLSSMLFLRKALYSVAGCNDTFASAGDYDLLLRLILAGKKGIRVNSPEQGRAAEECSQNDEQLLRRECGLIFSRLYGRAGYAMTPETGSRLWQEKNLPEELRKLLQPYCSRAFAASCSAADPNSAEEVR